MKKLSILFSVMLVLAMILSACGQEENETSDTSDDAAGNTAETLKVYTTLYPLEYFASRIGGDHVEVTNIVPAGADAHSFEPTANQMIEIADGDLFIYNGAGFEGFAERIKETIASHEVMILTAADGLEFIGYDHDHAHEEDDHAHEEDDHAHEEDDHAHEEDDHAHEEDDHAHEEDDHAHEEDGDDHGHAHGEEDPHVWLDPLRAVQLAENIKTALVELYPDGEELFTENFEALTAELEALDEEFVAMADEISKDTIVVSHAGYGYWDDRYGIHQIGIAGLSPTNEPSIKQIQETIAFVEANNITHIMFEQNIPVNIAETVRDEVGAEALWLHNLESLTQEELDGGEDYFTLMRSNIETLKTALQ
ncbi:zinc transport system substrate-binding protein [Evansella caseinilytica]|uniref:Zinc transport system substrate-binding protein n=1 Tax=Evansella caseinilytica TaxID=1503961 RepID=A0A1H3U8H0_9BACI|nr:zinc ABC transporter substrate-binding protein [Evansella caseinilytica]SDZ58726.1 zinc transport system substrate-binding protein [Evansella caseinilytica]